MQKTFLITGYPRSRTAWISNLLTYGPSFCYHEPGFSSSKFQRLFEIAGTPYAGVCEARAVIYWEKFLNIFPDSKIVVDRRDRAAVTKSLARFGFNFEDVADFYDQELAKLEKLGLSVPFEGLDGEAIWNHCIAEPINKVRLRMLNRCLISLNAEAIRNRPDPRNN